jgi:hypothetical protein
MTALETTLGTANITYEALRDVSHFIRYAERGVKFDGCVNGLGELWLFNDASKLLCPRGVCSALQHPQNPLARFATVTLLRSFATPSLDSPRMKSAQEWNAQNVVSGPISPANYSWLRCCVARRM